MMHRAAVAACITCQRPISTFIAYNEVSQWGEVWTVGWVFYRCSTSIC